MLKQPTIALGKEGHIHSNQGFVQLQPLSTAPMDLERPLRDQNLFVLQSEEQGQASISLRPKSKNFRRSLKKKTPSEIIKDSILKNRQAKRANSLKSITSQNLKLFFRLQEQKSQYKFTELHKELSCSILPLSRVNLTSRSRKENGQGQRVRCSSAVPALKNQCDSLRQTLKSNNSTSRTFKVLRCQEGSENVTQFFGSRISQKASIINDKENIICNKIEKLGINKLRLNEKAEELLLMKKLCINPNDENAVNKYRIEAKPNTKITIKMPPKAIKSLISQQNILAQRPVQPNFL